MTATTDSTEGLTPLAAGFCFGEGPRWFEGLLWFSDMLGEAVHTVDPGGSLTTLPLPGHAPRAGIPAGRLTADRVDREPALLRYDGESVITIADLSDVAPADLGDMVVDHLGRAYIGSRPSRAASSCASIRTTACGWSPKIWPSRTVWRSRPTTKPSSSRSRSAGD